MHVGEDERVSSIVLGVSGGVAAYKAALLLRALTEAGHDVRVVPTPGALHFVGAATFEEIACRASTHRKTVSQRELEGRNFVP